MFGWGRKRWMAALAVNDQDRAYFGLGPCGEYLYKLYREGKIEKPVIWHPGYGQELLFRAIEDLKRELEDLKRRLEKSQ